MAVTETPFTGSPVAMTNGKTQITFATPSDFEDWLVDHPDDLAKWHWCPA